MRRGQPEFIIPPLGLSCQFQGLISGWDPESKEGRAELEEAWEEDSKGKQGMARDDFYDAIFEVRTNCEDTCIRFPCPTHIDLHAYPHQSMPTHTIPRLPAPSSWRTYGRRR